MARFKKFRAPKISTVIGQHTEIQGDLSFSGGLHVDGTIRGNVTAELDSTSALTLSEAGQVVGDVMVPNVIINGKVKGDVYASERVELAPNARVIGTVYYRLLEMAMGAEVNGQLVHREEEALRMLGYDSPPEPLAGETEASVEGEVVAGGDSPAGVEAEAPRQEGDGPGEEDMRRSRRGR
jgi:cytoskeletal protein CcmA (bactofilin family)